MSFRHMEYSGDNKDEDVLAKRARKYLKEAKINGDPLDFMDGYKQGAKDERKLIRDLNFEIREIRFENKKLKKAIEFYQQQISADVFEPFWEEIKK